MNKEKIINWVWTDVYLKRLLLVGTGLYMVELALGDGFMVYRTYGDSAGAAKFSIKTTRECSRDSGLVGIELTDDAHEDKDRADEGTEEDGAEAGLEVRVGLGGEEAESVVVLVDGLAKVTTLLLVPPIAVGVTEGALDCRRVYVAAVLFTSRSIDAPIGVGRWAGDARDRDPPQSTSHQQSSLCWHCFPKRIAIVIELCGERCFVPRWSAGVRRRVCGTASGQASMDECKAFRRWLYVDWSGGSNTV